MLVAGEKQIWHSILQEYFCLQVGEIDEPAFRNVLPDFGKHYSIIPGGDHGALPAGKDVLEIFHQLPESNICRFSSVIFKNLIQRIFILIEALGVQSQLLKKRLKLHQFF